MLNVPVQCCLRLANHRYVRQHREQVRNMCPRRDETGVRHSSSAPFTHVALSGTGLLWDAMPNGEVAVHQYY